MFSVISGQAPDLFRVQPTLVITLNQDPGPHRLRFPHCCPSRRPQHSPLSCGLSAHIHHRWELDGGLCYEEALPGGEPGAF